MLAKTYRIVSATLSEKELRLSFSDGLTGSVPLSRIQPRAGKPDWSRVAIEMKGAHVAVPVSDGEGDQHEIPWDVLRAFCDPDFGGFAPPSSRGPVESK